MGVVCGVHDAKTRSVTLDGMPDDLGISYRSSKSKACFDQKC